MTPAGFLTWCVWPRYVPLRWHATPAPRCHLRLQFHQVHPRVVEDGASADLIDEAGVGDHRIRAYRRVRMDPLGAALVAFDGLAVDDHVARAVGPVAHAKGIADHAGANPFDYLDLPHHRLEITVSEVPYTVRVAGGNHLYLVTVVQTQALGIQPVDDEDALRVDAQEPVVDNGAALGVGDLPIRDEVQVEVGVLHRPVQDVHRRRGV